MNIDELINKHKNAHEELTKFLNSRKYKQGKKLLDKSKFREHDKLRHTRTNLENKSRVKDLLDEHKDRLSQPDVKHFNAGNVHNLEKIHYLSPSQRDKVLTGKTGYSSGSKYRTSYKINDYGDISSYTKTWK